MHKDLYLEIADLLGKQHDCAEFRNFTKCLGQEPHIDSVKTKTGAIEYAYDFAKLGFLLVTKKGRFVVASMVVKPGTWYSPFPLLPANISSSDHPDDIRAKFDSPPMYSEPNRDTYHLCNSKKNGDAAFKDILIAISFSELDSTPTHVSFDWSPREQAQG